MKDWLGNDLTVGDTVLYSSTSTLVGMNLGVLTVLEAYKIQLRIIDVSRYSYGSKGKLVTLHSGTSAFKSVTKYFGVLEGMDGQV